MKNIIKQVFEVILFTFLMIGVTGGVLQISDMLVKDKPFEATPLQVERAKKTCLDKGYDTWFSMTGGHVSCGYLYDLMEERENPCKVLESSFGCKSQEKV